MGEARVYHVWFATRRRKWLLQGEVEEPIKRLLRDAATRHGIGLLALETMIDHTHLLIRLQGGQELSKCMNLLKGASARGIFLEIPELKLDAHTEHFWQKRFGSKLVPPKAIKAVKRYKDRPEKYDRS